MCRGSRFAGHYCVHPAGSSCPLFAVGLVWPGVLARRASGECAGAHDSPDTTAFTLRAALVPSLRLAWCGLVFWPAGRPVNVPGLTIRRTLLRSPCGQLLSPLYGWPGGLVFWPAGRPVNVPGLTIRRTLLRSPCGQL